MNKERHNTYSVSAQNQYLSKAECMKKAEEIIREEYIVGMTDKEISKEIYFHAWAYHYATLLEKKNIHILDKLKRHADPIDLADYGDTPFRKMIYNLFWLFPHKRLNTK